MTRTIRRALTITAAIASLTFAGLASSANAAQPAPAPQNIITIPAPDQVAHVYRADECPWLRAFMAGTTAATTKVSAEDGHAISSSTAAGYGLLVAAPLVAAEYAMVGN